MEPLIWGYVVDKLAAMRVDACTQEVKDCFTADTRCGENFQNCIGMDYDYIHDICPLDSLVVCKANNPDFKMEDLDSMLMGLYLNIDNAALDQCQELVDKCDGGPIGEVPKAIRARMNLAQRASQVSVGTKTSSQLVIF